MVPHFHQIISLWHKNKFKSIPTDLCFKANSSFALSVHIIVSQNNCVKVAWAAAAKECYNQITTALTTHQPFSILHPLQGIKVLDMNHILQLSYSWFWKFTTCVRFKYLKVEISLMSLRKLGGILFAFFDHVRKIL